MKTKNIIRLFSIIITLISLPLQAAVHSLDQTGTISLTTGYVDNMSEEWDVTSTVTNQPLKIVYTTSTETKHDFVYIYSVDNSGNSTLLIELSGQQSGSVTTLLPNGKAKIIFTSDYANCYSAIYTGLNISFAEDSPSVVSSTMSVTGNTFINGFLGVGTSTPTKKFEVVDGSSGIFSFSAASCTSGYEIAQTIDDTGYKINVGSTIRNYKIATTGTDRLTISNTGCVGIGTTSPTQALNVVGGITVSPSGTGSNEIYNGALMITKPQVSGQYINLVRSGIIPWSIGTVYNSSTFAIGKGMVSDAAFTAPFFNIDMNGNVGIGTTTPASKLEVAGDITIPGGSRIGTYFSDVLTYENQTLGHYSLGWFNDSWNTGGASLWMSGFGGMKFFTGGSPRLSIDVSGNVGIGTTNPQNMLDVKGTIRAVEVKVESIDKFADFVFDPGYQLPTLNQVSSFIQVNKHLPDIPTATEVKENGMNLADMQVKLLQKIEELTLYMIDQQKTINQQSIQINQQNAKIEKLEKR